MLLIHALTSKSGAVKAGSTAGSPWTTCAPDSCEWWVWGLAGAGIFVLECCLMRMGEVADDVAEREGERREWRWKKEEMGDEAREEWR